MSLATHTSSVTLFIPLTSTNSESSPITPSLFLLSSPIQNLPSLYRLPNNNPSQFPTAQMLKPSLLPQKAISGSTPTAISA
ncbi:unnamed protein product [Coffea canephora]|uniref:DH200=94 genomic scaffold, scaffold_8467 n=1 Tax=Coffea canephora TaxID=49390 RepID=A0A068VMF2_COFCA|nr:unnamed protein product [Coffea canephora]